MSGAGMTDDAKAFLSAQNPAEREQYLDFFRLRRFRQSLLVRQDAPRDPASHLARLTTMHVAADPSLLRPQRLKARSRSLRATSILPEVAAARCAKCWRRSLRIRRRRCR